MRPTWADVDLTAVAHNLSAIAAHVAPSRVCAVVKADGYGHGAIRVALAAASVGIDWLAVALPEEGAALRQAGVGGHVLVLAEPNVAGMALCAAENLVPAVYTAAGIDAAARAGIASVHLKVDTGMHRVGARPVDLPALLDVLRARQGVELGGLWTHLAVADEPANPFTHVQLGRFAAARKTVADAGFVPDLVHAANSAAAIAVPEARFDLVRVGIATYGLDPDPALTGAVDLRAAMSLRSLVSHVQRVPAGDGISYGLTHTFERDSNVATVPIGYADGVPRRLSAVGGCVRVNGGPLRPIVGRVTMDQLMVDCGDDPIAVGDEVLLFGPSGPTAWDWARPLDTIAYEIVCGIGPRVRRRYVTRG